MLWRIFASVTFGKLLFIPSYRSTDFEVHRNWLAITHSLPLNKWYIDDTSQWTLDYPPLFAWFEYILSWGALLFDPEMLKVNNLNYASQNTILFQRISVILTDIVYALGVQKCLYSFGNNQGGKVQKDAEKWFSSSTILAFLLLCNVGLFMVDHIHFQYNGFLTGILLLSVGSILQKENLKAAFWFSILLNLKHIYLYIAPVYAVYLLRSYCFDIQKSKMTFHFKRLIKLGVIVVTTFGFTYGPFVSQLQQVLSRLFPFENRGLCHAYWAPNFWALYNIVDKILAFLGHKLGWIDPLSKVTASMTGGLVQEFEHAILPSIGPKTTLVFTILAILPAVVILLKQPNQPRVFIRAIVLCAFASFLFGWHVHEKAILIVITPLTLLAVSSQEDCRLFMLLSITGHVSLFPLLFTPFENVLKIVVVLTYSLASYSFLSALHYDPKSKGTLLKFRSWERFFLYGLGFVALFESCIHSMVDPSGRLPFLPLMIMSVYCAVGIIYVWFSFVIGSLKTEKKISKQK
ncbi:Dolichyl pyrophosphate Glc1Man9GlcNAc2 alpha-1,3-glucosyltransferase [Daphnia magna]|uniref:Alpha-1,3-glucosyltransferase n=2 Tax=Daphnia magna TaxID=35525 RepID=A0A0P4ZF64_9CRUS|nr:hypothetical protein OUZ56_004687 [Daphnia magna]KZS07843.1 Dolichyl pyrophosphate Glc1Man9GlcNAc2 alpha-1,3-glucosyltransferase [Daphnia magna]CAG4639215.1 EOG090X06YP [Daphnia magna]